MKTFSVKTIVDLLLFLIGVFVCLNILDLYIYLKIFLSFYLLLYLPGDCIVGIFAYGAENYPERLVLSFVFSFCLFIPFGLIAFVLNLNIYIFLLSYLSFIAVLVVWNDGWQSNPFTFDFDVSRGSFIVLVTCGFVVLNLFLFKVEVTPDALSTFAEVRKLTDIPEISNIDIFYENIKVQPGYNYNISNLMIASLGKLAAVDMIQLILLFPFFMSAVILASIYIFSEQLFKNRETALITVIVFLIIFAGVEREEIFKTSFFQIILSLFVFIPAGYTFAFKYFDRGKKKDLITAGILGLAAASCHPFGFLAYILGYVFYLFWVLILKGGGKKLQKRLLALILLCILFASPHIILQLMSFKLTFVTESAYSPWRPLRISKSLFLINPSVIFAPHYLVRPPFSPRIYYAFAFLLGLVLIFRARENRAFLFIFSLTYTPLLIVLNPLIYPVLGKIMTFQLLRRFAQIPPVYLIYPVLIGFVFRRHSTKLKKIVLPVLVGLFLILYVPLTIKNISGKPLNPNLSIWKLNFRKNPYLPDMMNKPERKYPLLKKLRSLETPSGIAADYDTGMMITAYSNHFLLGVHPQYVSLAATREPVRRKALRAIYNNPDSKRLRKYIRTFGIDYIVFDKKTGQSYGNTGRLDFYRKHSDVFKSVFSGNGYLLLKIKQGKLEALDSSEE